MAKLAEALALGASVERRVGSNPTPRKRYEDDHMPTYEYTCRNCGETFSAVRAMADRKKRVRCQSCGSTRSELVLSRCSFTLQGGGWSSQGYSSTSGGKK